MKRTISKSLYRILLLLSNRINNQLLVKLKLLLGVYLIMLTGSCSNHDDEPEIMCYDPVVPRDSLEMQSTYPTMKEAVPISEIIEDEYS